MNDEELQVRKMSLETSEYNLLGNENFVSKHEIRTAMHSIIIKYFCLHSNIDNHRSFAVL